MTPLSSFDLAARRYCFFITVATRARRSSLGRLSESGVRLSALGHEVAAAWDRIGVHRPWVSTGPFIVMPDHVHGLLWWDAVPPNCPTSVSVVVGGFKADSTRAARSAGLVRFDQMIWQAGFRARDVQSDASFMQVARYIENNPAAAWARQNSCAGSGVLSSSASPPPDGGGSADGGGWANVG